MKRISIFILGFLLFYKTCLSDENIYFNFDYALFKTDNDESILEVYYSVNQKNLKYILNGSMFEAAAKIDISILDVSNDNVLISNIYKTPSVTSDTADEKLMQKLVGQLNYLLKDGNYKLKITGSDFNDSTKQDIYEENINISNYSDNSLKVSDIEFSTLIHKANDDKSIFYKNTLEVVPNPSNLFGMNLKDLYYYFEMYNLKPENISDEFNLNYSIANINNDTVISFSKNIKRTSESKADYGKVKVDSLKRGSYTLSISLNDPAKNVNITGQKKFFIFNNIDNVSTTNSQDDFLKTEYAAMNKKTLDNEFDKSQYIMTDQEINKFENLLSLDDKRKYMYNFWKSKNTNPNSPILDRKIAYFKRILEANKTYKEAYKEGWKTDRGRILIIYGKPDDIERFPFEADTKSYEIWKYNSVEGGGESVFIERQPSTGVYWLVHSTFRNEMRNDQWQTELKQ